MMERMIRSQSWANWYFSNRGVKLQKFHGQFAEVQGSNTLIGMKHLSGMRKTYNRIDCQ